MNIKTTLEGSVENYLRDSVKDVGGWCIKLPAIYETGIPDRIVIMPGGKICFVELKRPVGGKHTAIQKYQMNKLKSLGCMARLVSNKADVQKLIEEMQNEWQSSNPTTTNNSQSEK